MGELEKFSRQLRAVQLRDGERVVDAWFAGVAMRLFANGTKVGGTLVLTDQRLIFQPLKMPTTTNISPYGYDLDAWADESYFALELSSVQDVGVDEDRRSAIVVTGPERSATLNVSRSRWSNAFSKKNVVARDDALRTIRRALSGQFSV